MLVLHTSQFYTSVDQPFEATIFWRGSELATAIFDRVSTEASGTNMLNSDFFLLLLIQGK